MSETQQDELDKLSETQKYLLYFSKFHPKPSVTVLMKLCYLLDLMATSENKGKLTDFDYCRYSFGPFDQKIYRELEKLVKLGFAHQDTDYTKLGTEVVFYKVSDQFADNVKLDSPGRDLAEELLEAVKGYGAKELTQIAYKTKPMLALKATLGGTENIGKALNLSV